MELALNGEPRAAIAAAGTGFGFESFGPFEWDLAAGRNVVTIAGRNPPMTAPPDSRLLGIALRNVTVTIAGSGACVPRF